MSAIIRLPMNLAPELGTSSDDNVTRPIYFEPCEEVMRELVEDLFVNNWRNSGASAGGSI